ncbi:MAG: hypothetical protein MKZ95_06025 [Pirellulales bacterium]|nr:hypothetical protein [Pirellulales bacterium]
MSIRPEHFINETIDVGTWRRLAGMYRRRDRWGLLACSPHVCNMRAVCHKQ